MDDLYAALVLQVTTNAVLPAACLAYIGPGTGLSALGALLAVLAAIFIAVFGFVWFPVKRLFKWLRRKGWIKSSQAKTKV